MVTIRRAMEEDSKFIRSVYLNESILPHIIDDWSIDPLKIDFSTMLSFPQIYFLIPEKDKIPVGVFLLHPWNSITYELHTAILPEYRGEVAVESCNLMGKYMFIETPCQKILTHVPTTNAPARALAVKCKMVMEGINRKSFLSGGVLYDQYIFGSCKEDVK
jgi:RimJ/RimL family protein N-acetyltransferase